MVLFFVGVFFFFLVSFIVFLLAWLFSKRAANNREKMSPFECGFDPKSSARVPFSVRFFLLAVIFLIFDVEIALLLPAPLVVGCSYDFSVVFGVFFFVFILVVGLGHEWNQGSLDWVEDIG